MTDVGGGPELFRLVRFWARRWAPGVAGATRRAHVQHVQVVEAVSAASRASGDEVSVPAVAHQLGVDRSVASRMINEAVTAGYCRRQRSTADARRVEIRLTRKGRELLDAAHRWQQARFDELVAHWSVADKRKFARYLARLADEVIADLTPER